MNNDLKKIITLFEFLNLKYYLIRPIDFSNLLSLSDIDIVMGYKDIIILLKYLESENISYYCENNYVFNKILININNFYIDIDININSFTPHKLIVLDNNIQTCDYLIFDDKKIPILAEPYLFLNWTLHYILDKKSFLKGGSYLLYQERYRNIYLDLLLDENIEILLRQIYYNRTKEVIDILKVNLFETKNILEIKSIRYLYHLAILEQDLYLKQWSIRIKFGIKRRIDKYVFRKNKKNKNCIREIRLFSK